MRTFTVLGLLDRVIESLIDDRLIFNNSLLHCINECPTDTTAATCVDETVLRAGIEGVLAVHELWVKNNVTLLRLRLEVWKTLPVHQILCACNTCCCNCRRKIACRRIRILAFNTEDAVNPTILMCCESHIVYISRRLTIFRHCDRTIPETEVIHSVRALCHRKERLAVSTLDTNYKNILSIPFDCSGIEGGMHLETLHEIWICFLVEVISPEQRSVGCCDNRVHIALIYAITFNRFVLSGNEGLMM